MLNKNSSKLVNTLQGTNSRREFSTGNTYPAVGVPRGMTYWTPQTSDGRFIFDRTEEKLCGIRATHSPSPWMGDYGHFDIFPIVGPMQPTPSSRASKYDVEAMVASPNSCQMRLLRYGIDVSFAASSRCAVFEMDFPSDGDAAIVLQTGFAEGRTYGEIQIRRLEHSCEILGTSYSNHGGCPEGYGCFFVAEVQSVAREIGVFDENLIATDADRHSGPRVGAYVRLDPGQKTIVRVATSFISIDQARQNLHQEIRALNLKQVAEASESLWSAWLGRIQTEGGSESAHSCLATAMYRVGLFPMSGHEPDGKGGFHHRSPYDGQIHAGKLFTNNGFWDTHRTVYPLLALIDPEGFGEIVGSLLQACRRTGWLPKWISPGYRDCMVSSHIDSVISEAILRDIPGFDYEEAFQAIRRNAFDISDDPTCYGRLGLEQYDRLGYVPFEAVPYSVSRTLDFAHCDWCVAQVARKLGHNSDADYLTLRSQNYENLWFSPAGLMRPKDSSGSWQEPWSPFAWGSAYIEGGPWQHSFNVPHDPQGLAELIGGSEKLILSLDQMLQLSPTFTKGSYPETIHEMSEMVAAKDQAGQSFGQYAHSNQPVHGYLWIPAALGRSDWTSHQVDRVLRSLYSQQDLPGDEDNGEMSAWYVLAAMGQFPLCPGSGEMVLAPSTLFDRITVAEPALTQHRIDVPSRILPPKIPSGVPSSQTLDRSSVK